MSTNNIFLKKKKPKKKSEAQEWTKQLSLYHLILFNFSFEFTLTHASSPTTLNIHSPAKTPDQKCSSPSTSHHPHLLTPHTKPLYIKFRTSYRENLRYHEYISHVKWQLYTIHKSISFEFFVSSIQTEKFKDLKGNSRINKLIINLRPTDWRGL